MGECPYQQLYDCIVRGGACVLAGQKPAALFNYIPRNAVSADHSDGRLSNSARAARPKQLVEEFSREFNLQFSPVGLRLDLMFATTGRALLLLSRTADLARLLGHPQTAAYLTERGYPVANIRQLIAEFKRRFATYEQNHIAGVKPSCACEACCFPHEIGIVLGYPLEDVRGFIDNGGRGSTAHGLWKSYGNEEEARKRWDNLAFCRSSVIDSYRNGTPFEALIA